jgi:hypothetical protein
MSYTLLYKERHTMSIINMLEKLAEMFPKQDYHTRLDRYISSKQPKNTADVEYLQRQFEQQNHRGLIL